MDLDSVAAELFGLALGDFTSVRNERSKQAKAEGDRDLAAQIQRLRKPTSSAWLVNQLARQHAGELEPLLELGRDLREAGALLSGDELRALTRQRHQVVHALVQLARRLGRDQGLKVGTTVADEVRETLEASLADADAAHAVLVGRLSHPLHEVGFGVVESNDGTTPPEAGAQSGTQSATQPATQPATASPADVTDLDSRRRERAERKRQQAARAVEKSESALRRAQQERQAATEARESADAETERLRAELGRAERAAATATDDERAKQQQVERAEGTLRDAHDAHEQATAKLDALGD